jgi:hypothetical protein
LWTTTLQRHVRGDALARVNSYITLGAYGLGPIGLAAAGPIAAAVGTIPVLIAGAAWQAVTAGIMISLPAVRALVPTPSTMRAVEFGRRSSAQHGSDLACDPRATSHGVPGRSAVLNRDDA